MFRKYHYLNHDLNNSAQCYVAKWGNRLVGFIAIMHFPHPLERKWKSVHRLVVLPDYQGVGIGIVLLEAIGRMYVKEGFRYKITTSNPALCRVFATNDNWRLIKTGRSSKFGSSSSLHNLNVASSKSRLTTSWEYINKLNN